MSTVQSYLISNLLTYVNTYLYRPNITLSATYRPPLQTLNTHTTYVPPHPQRGSPYHRYTLLLLPHTDPTARVTIPPLSNEARVGFDLRSFCAKHGLDPGAGGAAHMWREVWDETVSDIYAHTLSACYFCSLVFQTDAFLIHHSELPEPSYGLPPRPDKYAEIRRVKKFIA